MNVKNKLRNNLIRKIQKLSTAKLSEINNLLSKLEDQLNSKENTLKLAGTWKSIEEDLFLDLTSNLHANRTRDRQIS